MGDSIEKPKRKMSEAQLANLQKGRGKKKIEEQQKQQEEQLLADLLLPTNHEAEAIKANGYVDNDNDGNTEKAAPTPQYIDEDHNQEDNQVDEDEDEDDDEDDDDDDEEDYNKEDEDDDEDEDGEVKNNAVNKKFDVDYAAARFVDMSETLMVKLFPTIYRSTNLTAKQRASIVKIEHNRQNIREIEDHEIIAYVGYVNGLPFSDPEKKLLSDAIGRKLKTIDFSGVSANQELLGVVGLIFIGRAYPLLERPLLGKIEGMIDSFMKKPKPKPE